jgi:hypothetical protein
LLHFYCSTHNYDDEAQELSSMQSMNSAGSTEEVAYPSHSRLAYDVTLSSGAVVVKGGRGSEKKAWMSSIPNQWTGVGRKGHAPWLVA